MKSKKLNADETRMDSSKEKLLAMIYWLSKSSNDRIGRHLGDRDWTVRQVQLLDAIEQNEGCSQLVLARESGIDTSTVSDMMIRLSSRGLITRKRSKRDSRAYTIWLTVRGRDLLTESKAVLSSLEGNLLSSLTSEQRTEFLALLNKVVSETRSRLQVNGHEETAASSRLDRSARIIVERTSRTN